MAILLVAFLTKAGMWPLSFWLPTAYAAASPPVAAIFAVMTKVGVYVTLRMLMLASGDPADPTGIVVMLTPWLLYGGIATIVYGSVGALSSRELPASRPTPRSSRQARCWQPSVPPTNA